MTAGESDAQVGIWQEQQQLLLELTLALRDCTRSEQWDLVPELTERQTGLMQRLGGDVPDHIVAVLGADVVAAMIENVALAHAEALARLEAWQQEMAQSMRQMENVQTNVNRLSKAYR